MLEKKLQCLDLRLQKHGHIKLPAGSAQKRIVLRGLRGTEHYPLILEGTLEGSAPKRIASRKAPLFARKIEMELDHQADRAKFFTKLRSDQNEDQFRKLANEAAFRRQEGGHYPTVAELADQAVLTLVDCQHVIIRNIAFEDCWPTAIYLDDCQFITLDQLRFDRGTYCIGASGRNTHDLVIENCRYRGEPKIWKEVQWGQIHGALDVKHPVDVQDDQRHLDGDFFRGWDIFGNVTIRNNWIGDCFNAIHFFTSHSGRRRDVKSPLPFNKDVDAYEDGGATNALDLIAGINVLIENNVFYHVRDNCIEPEAFAYNWVVRYNRMDSCYKPFSLGVKQIGWFYVYGNTGFMNERPGEKDHAHAAPSLMKLGKKQNLGGPFYMVHNSWFLSKKHLNKRMLRGLHHFNNAIEFDLSNVGSIKTKPKSGGLLGAGPWGALPPSEQKDPAQRKSFTRQWSFLGIQIDGDICNDHFLNRHIEGNASHYEVVGYALGLSMQYAANVLKSGSDDYFELTEHAKKIQSPVAFHVRLPKRYGEGQERVIEAQAGENCGALGPGRELYDPFPVAGGTVEDFPFLPKIFHEHKLEKLRLVDGRAD